jgi:hypothetical protein
MSLMFDLAASLKYLHQSSLLICSCSGDVFVGKMVKTFCHGSESVDDCGETNILMSIVLNGDCDTLTNCVSTMIASKFTIISFNHSL